MYECIKNLEVSEELKKEINLFLCNCWLDEKQHDKLVELFNKAKNEEVDLFPVESLNG